MKITLQLPGQFSKMPAFKLPDFFFLFTEIFARLFELTFEELGRILRLRLPCFQVFADKEIGKLAGYLLSDPWIA